MATKRTQGKWTAFDNEKGDMTIQSDIGELIGCVWEAPTVGAMEANAKLIVVAPVMYQFITEYASAMKTKSKTVAGLNIYETAMYKSAQELIKKAGQ